MEPKGYVLCKSEFTATKIWPGPQLTLSGMVDLEAEYKKALAGKQVIVMDIAVDGKGYLVLAKGEKCGDFIWAIEKEDTINGSFLPVKWKCGQLIPAGLTPMEEFAFLAKNYNPEIEKYKYK